MRWRGRRQSSNIEDRRSSGGRRSGGGLRLPGGLRFPRPRMPRGGGRRMGRGAGIGGLGLIAFVVIALLLGVDPRMLLTGDGMQGQVNYDAEQPQRAPDDQSDSLRDFVAVVLADTEDVWGLLFKQTWGEAYPEPRLVLFSGGVQSGCGFAGSAVGPFYCPADQKIYLDMSFFKTLADRFDAPGDFAQAYVIAHEVGHHVQTILGISQQVHEAKASVSRVEANALSVRQELQADCFAGVWANHAERLKGILEPGDVEEALTAASAIGDDILQRKTQGHVVPDSFTHGTSKQRVRWFRRGFDSGLLSQCDTFEANRL
ncbi:MAG: neutral zinc metallopeptidase [Pseudomonadota bacterium]